MEIKLQSIVRKNLLPISSVAALIVAIALSVVNFTTIPPTRIVLVAAKPLSEGAQILESDLVPVKVSAGFLLENYLTEFTPDLTLTQSLSKGELVPKLALENQKSQLIPVRLNNLSPISKAVSVGDRVDIWASRIVQGNAAAPEAIAYDALVVAIESNSSMAQNTTSVELRISSDYLEGILQAADSNYKISVILHETLADIQ